MNVTLGLGAEVDIASGAEVKEMGDGLLSAFKGDRQPKAIRFVRTASLASTGSGRQVMDLGSPPVGSEWHLIALTSFGNDDTTAVTGVRGALYTGGSVVNLSLANLLIPGLSFPGFYPLADSELYVQAQEQLLVATDLPGTAGQNFGVNIRLEEWRIVDRERLNGRV